jgi:hypothetical protein
LQGIFHRTDLENKILFLEKAETPWTLYINGSPTDFIVAADIPQWIDNVYGDVLMHRDDRASSIRAHLILPAFLDVLIYAGAELVHAPANGAPNGQNVVVNNVALAWHNPDTGFIGGSSVLDLDVDGAFSVHIDFGYNKVSIDKL